MARVTVELPSLLAPFAGGASRFHLEAETLAGAWRALARERPELALHLFDERGALREHVLCFLNGESSRWRGGADRDLADGDVLRFLQAVSGG